MKSSELKEIILGIIIICLSLVDRACHRANTMPKGNQEEENQAEETNQTANQRNESIL